MRLLLIPLLLVMSLAANNEFKNRLEAAEAIKQTVEGQAYSTKVDAALIKVFMSCRQPKNDKQACPLPFSIVANVNSKGEVLDIAAQPSTSLSDCFKSKLAAITLPSPPASLVGSHGFPISFEMGTNTNR